MASKGLRGQGYISAPRPEAGGTQEGAQRRPPGGGRFSEDRAADVRRRFMAISSQTFIMGA